MTGNNFVAGAVLQMGGVPAGSVSVVNPTRITATAPGLPPGTVNDIAVTNPGGASGSLLEGWFADFLDVPQTHGFHDDIETVFRNGVSAGCGAGNYCPASFVTRAQIAVLLLKGEHGESYQPPACSGTVFIDVPCPAGQNVHWINQLAAEGITGGCGGGRYCPGSPLTREQMAVFLLKGKHGGAYQAPACSATIFSDVPCPAGQFVNWINQLSAEGITAGCGGGNYCPDATTPRGQMATFLVRTFSLAPAWPAGPRVVGPRARRP